MPPGTKARILDRLKRRDGLTTGALAAELGITEVAVRQHLDDLAADGLVERGAGTPRGPGRPAVEWSLSEAAHDRFPDRHGELTVSLIASIRAALGEGGLDRVIDARTAQQLDDYRAALPGLDAPLRDRVRALADRRTDEGYMADVVEEDGALLLVENHCPICDAASSCLGLCRAELDLFRRALGEDARAERTEHLLSGGRRCVYRISSVVEHPSSRPD